MVHALDEIRRVLKPNGVVEIVSSAGWQVSGRLNDLPIAVADDEAAFQAMREAESKSWFVKKEEKEFSFFYSWDTPSEMKEFMDTEWEGFEKLEDNVYQKTKSLWASANADAGVRVRVKIVAAKWEKWRV